MKLNNKGFAISSVMYLILILALVLVSLIVALLVNRKIIIDKQKKETLGAVEGGFSDGLSEKHVYTVPKSGYYKLEAWGAQGGGNETYIGGYGGYSTGIIYLEKHEKLYVNIGGSGVFSTADYDYLRGGYNGGGNTLNSNFGWSNSDVIEYHASGGGATHIALDSGELSELSDHAIDDRILIVASGGGGAGYFSNNSFYANFKGGSGGGIIGSLGSYDISSYLEPYFGEYVAASQTSASSLKYNTTFNQGEFGKGSNGYSGGGGGYYGGAGSYGRSSGGSGYIGNTNLVNKHMYCYNCSTSDIPTTKTITGTCANSNPKSNCAKKGNGYAKITYVDLGNYYINNTSKDYINGEYTDTGFKLNWNKDFTIEAIINVPALNQRYLVLGSYDDSSEQEINIEISKNSVVSKNNKLRVWFGATGLVNEYSVDSISVGEDIKINFYWDSSNKRFVATAKGTNTNASVSGSYPMTGKTINSLRTGTCDYRGSCVFNQLTLKSISIFNT